MRLREIEANKQSVSVNTAILVKMNPPTHLRGYESKLLSVQEQAWEHHGVPGWLGLREIAVMHF